VIAALPSRTWPAKVQGLSGRHIRTQEQRLDILRIAPEDRSFVTRIVLDRKGIQA